MSRHIMQPSVPLTNLHTGQLNAVERSRQFWFSYQPLFVSQLNAPIDRQTDEHTAQQLICIHKCNSSRHLVYDVELCKYRTVWASRAPGM